ncbi:MAG: exosome complex RNA-binding protein Csl4 [Candidatus Anstonellaceae archaeon]
MENEEKIYTYPGDYLGLEEEFEAGDGTYIKDGMIYSFAFGKIKKEKRKIFVEQPKKLMNFFVGQKVIGRIEMIVEPIALVKVIDFNEIETRRFFQTGQNLVLKVENIKKGFVKKIQDEYKIGDIIRAEIIEIKNGEYRLSTISEDCGVIKAYNSSYQEPRNPLVKINNTLMDIKTNRKENRKIASDYLIKL